MTELCRGRVACRARVVASSFAAEIGRPPLLLGKIAAHTVLQLRAACCARAARCALRAARAPHFDSGGTAPPEFRNSGESGAARRSPEFRFRDLGVYYLMFSKQDAPPSGEHCSSACTMV